MNRRQWLAGAAALALAPAAAGVAPPATPRRPLRIEQLGRVRIDDYAWLKDPHWKAVWRDPARLDPAIRAHLEAENAYAQAVLAPTRPVQAALAASMRARGGVGAEPPPVADGPWLYGERLSPGAQRPVVFRRPVHGAAEQVLLEPDARAAGHAFFAVRGAVHSPDHRLFAWAEDAVGAENFIIQVRDLETGEILPGPAEHAFGDFAFSPDSRWLFWTWRDENSRPAKVFRRPARGGADVLVYEETDPAFLLEVARPASGQFVLIRAWNADASEVWLIDGEAPASPPRLVEPRTPGLVYSVEPWGPDLVILTNADGAIDFKLMLADPRAPGRAHWRPWKPCRPGRYIAQVRAFAGHLARIERVDADPLVVVATREGSEVAAPFDEPAYAVDFADGGSYDSATLRLRYRSPRTPPQWLDLDMTTGALVLVRQTPVAGFDRDAYRVERLFARASDGALVPITLLRRTDLPTGAPLYLTGYGAYGVALEADFSADLLSLADRGFAFAIAHVRGGSEKGWEWFLAARRGTKMLSFTDFVACAEHLGCLGIGGAGRIVAHGYSAGGLLVGAALNLRPDLFAGVIGQAPFVDVLNTMSDATHPLVPLARPDWGDPLADPAAYDWIAAYSPYDNVARRPYPPVLATTAVSDDRVGYWEPAKWIARLRARDPSTSPKLLLTAMAGGHGAGLARDEEVARNALFYAFALWTIGRLRAAPAPAAAS